jgi:toxin-antitoxin system PIN domain toxin
MTLADPLHLIDVNILIARIFEGHEHHRAAVNWFNTPGLQWALCPWSEAGFIRYATRPGRLSMAEATAILEELAQHPGYHYRPIAHDWRTLTKPFYQRLHGHKQVTDACLLGLAIRHGLILATFDKRILHLAGEYGRHVQTLGA